MFISTEEKRYLFEEIRLLQLQLSGLRSELEIVMASKAEATKSKAKRTWTEEEKKKRSDYMKAYHAKLKAEKEKA